MAAEKRVVIKIPVLGCSNVGKTSLMKRFGFYVTYAVCEMSSDHSSVVYFTNAILVGQFTHIYERHHPSLQRGLRSFKLVLIQPNGAALTPNSPS